jgi:hypothetical protein
MKRVQKTKDFLKSVITGWLFPVHQYLERRKVEKILFLNVWSLFRPLFWKKMLLSVFSVYRPLTFSAGLF